MISILNHKLVECISKFSTIKPDSRSSYLYFLKSDSDSKFEGFDYENIPISVYLWNSIKMFVCLYVNQSPVKSYKKKK